MSYIQIEIGGKLRGLKFNMQAMRQLSKNSIEFESVCEDDPELFFVYNIFHSGLVGYSKEKIEIPDYTFSDVQTWVNDLYENRKDNDRQLVVDAFMNCRSVKDTIDKVKSENKPAEEKKSKSRKKSKITGMSV